MKIYCLSKIDNLKGNWWLWEAERHNDDGTVDKGTVQAMSNSEGIAEDTFEKDDA